jgi:hypothetical protein
MEIVLLVLRLGLLEMAAQFGERLLVSSETLLLVATWLAPL